MAKKSKSIGLQMVSNHLSEVVGTKSTFIFFVERFANKKWIVGTNHIDMADPITKQYL